MYLFSPVVVVVVLVGVAVWVSSCLSVAGAVSAVISNEIDMHLCIRFSCVRLLLLFSQAMPILPIPEQGAEALKKEALRAKGAPVLPAAPSTGEDSFMPSPIGNSFRAFARLPFTCAFMSGPRYVAFISTFVRQCFLVIRNMLYFCVHTDV